MTQATSSLNSDYFRNAEKRNVEQFMRAYTELCRTYMLGVNETGEIFEMEKEDLHLVWKADRTSKIYMETE